MARLVLKAQQLAGEAVVAEQRLAVSRGLGFTALRGRRSHSCEISTSAYLRILLLAFGWP
jgi:hypothetical protein